jgi:regulator of PEP synthase PpsR (kinase-PPPase family)
VYKIFVVSDGSGHTAEQALQAALTQFTQHPVSIEIRPEVRTGKRVSEVVEEAADSGGFIIHTMVSRDLRNAVADQARLHNIETIDLMGPLLAQLTHQFSVPPLEKPGLFRELNKEYFRRIEAMEFALRHDDGQRTDELVKADLVLVGVSRTFKTPLSIYLAFRGWLVGNVPIVYDLPVPPVLFELPPTRVFCLTTDPHNLSILRRVRHEYLGGATGDYASLDFVWRELTYAKNIFNTQPGWAMIEVTRKPIEEIVSEILAIIRRRRMSDRSEGTD